VADLIDLIERAKEAEATSRHARAARCNDAPAHIAADLYVMRTYPVIEITLGLGTDCTVRQVGITRSIERRRI
jgi:thiamine phosphate synthase YjbQ (UPF0047 family)